MGRVQNLVWCETPLVEAFGGYFVVINEDLHEEFEGFKKKVYML